MGGDKSAFFRLCMKVFRAEIVFETRSVQLYP